MYNLLRAYVFGKAEFFIAFLVLLQLYLLLSKMVIKHDVFLSEAFKVIMHFSEPQFLRSQKFDFTQQKSKVLL